MQYVHKSSRMRGLGKVGALALAARVKAAGLTPDDHAAEAGEHAGELVVVRAW